jgi:hypothetical protein
VLPRSIQVSRGTPGAGRDARTRRDYSTACLCAYLIACLAGRSFAARAPSAQCTLERQGDTATLALSARTRHFTLERSFTFGAHAVEQRFRVRTGKRTLVDAFLAIDDAGRTTMMTLRYSRALKKVRLLTFRSDGRMLEGKLNGRPFAAVPLAQFSSVTEVRYRDGKPVRKIGAYRPSLGRALERLTAAVEGLKTCSESGVQMPITPGFAAALIPRQPGVTRFGIGDIVSWGAKQLGADDCTACKIGCSVDGFACGVGAGAVATASGGAGAVAIGACLYNFYTCVNDCGCQMSLCELAGGDGYFECENVCCPPGSKCNHVADGLCCSGGQVVTPDGQCCDANRTCGDTCCGDSAETCNQTSGLCCPAEEPPCGAGCCKPNLCTPNGTCCTDSPFTTMCGAACCNTLSPCFPEISLCGPIGATKCGFGNFCEAGETCIGTICCPDARACGNKCCPANQRCTDPVSETCELCSALLPNPVSCPSGDTICCFPGVPGEPAWNCCGGMCCQNCCFGVCYPLGAITPCTPR